MSVPRRCRPRPIPALTGTARPPPRLGARPEIPVDRDRETELAEHALQGRNLLALGAALEHGTRLRWRRPAGELQALDPRQRRLGLGGVGASVRQAVQAAVHQPCHPDEVVLVTGRVDVVAVPVFTSNAQREHGLRRKSWVALQVGLEGLSVLPVVRPAGQHQQPTALVAWPVARADVAQVRPALVRLAIRELLGRAEPGGLVTGLRKEMGDPQPGRDLVSLKRWPQNLPRGGDDGGLALGPLSAERRRDLTHGLAVDRDHPGSSLMPGEAGRGTAPDLQ